MEFLNKFFGNLLLNQDNVLDNRDLQIKEEPQQLAVSKEKILLLIRNNANITTKQLSEQTGLSVAGIEKNLRQLKQANKTSYWSG